MNPPQNSASDTIRLITEIVILASAIVGIYKVATAKPETAGAPANAGKREWPDLVKAIGAYFGVFTFMLVPLIFMLVLKGFTKLMDGPLSTSKPKSLPAELKTGFDPSKLSERGMLAYRVFQAGTAMGSEPEKDKVLSRAVELGIRANDLQVSLAAAQAIGAIPTKDNQLRRVMDAAVKMGALDVAVTAINSMEASPEKDEAGREFTAAAENWSNFLQSKGR